MDLKDLGGQLIGAGAPVLGKIIGGLLPIPGGSIIGEQAGALLAKAFGASSTEPAVIAEAIEKEDPAVAIAKIKAAEVEAAARWPALADMARAQHEAETARFQAELADVQNARSRDISVRAQNNGTNARANLLIVGAFAALLSIVVFVFMKIQDLNEPGAVAVLTFLTTIGGQVTGWIGSVFQFEFGATRQGGDRSNQLADMAQQVIGINAVPKNVVSPAVAKK